MKIPWCGCCSPPFCQTCANVFPTTVHAMQVNGTETPQALEITNFKPVRGWCYRYMRLVGLSLSHRTPTRKKTPADFQEKLLNFRQYFIHLKTKQNCAFQKIGSANETAFYFCIPWNVTVMPKVQKKLKLQAKVMKAACTSNGVHNCWWP
jgi:hypothetical protein